MAKYGLKEIPTRKVIKMAHQEATLAQADMLAGHLAHMLPENPKVAVDDGMPKAQRAPVLSIIAAVQKVIQAIANRDFRAAVAGVRDILTMIVGDEGGTISFAPGAAAAGIADWGKLPGLLSKLLELLLPLLLKA